VRRGGDIIIAIDDQPVSRFEDLVSYLVTKASPGQVVRLTVIRGDTETTIDVTLGARPSSPVATRTDTGPREINARSAIAIAEQAVADAELLTGEIVEKVATPDSSGATRVWIVELSTETETATVTIDAETGDVLDIEVE
jgi:Zn-dependent metalloprotease